MKKGARMLFYQIIKGAVQCSAVLPFKIRVSVSCTGNVQYHIRRFITEHSQTGFTEPRQVNTGKHNMNYQTMLLQVHN